MAIGPYFNTRVVDHRYIKLCNFILLRMIHNITYQFIVQTHINQLIYNLINLVGMIIEHENVR